MIKTRRRRQIATGATRARTLLLATLCAIAASALSSTPAMAERTYVKESSFGSGGALPQEPRGLALDQQTGDVLVADQSSVQRFVPLNRSAPSSGYILGSPLPLSGSFTNAFAVGIDNTGGLSNGDVYVADAGAKAIYKFNQAGNPIEVNPPSNTTNQFGAGAKLTALSEPTGVAVDPSNGNVYVSDYSNNNVDVYTPSGEFVEGSQFRTGSGPQGLAFNSTGSRLYVLAANEGKVEEFTPSGVFEKVIDNSGTATGVAVDPTTNDVYVVKFQGSVAVYDSTGTPLSPPGFQTGIFFSQGIAVDSVSGAVYVPDTTNRAVDVYQLVTLPIVTTETASQVTETGARLEGTVNPEGAAVTSCIFEYGTTSTSYEYDAPCVPTPAEIGTGTESVHVYADVTGLLAHNRYHFRLVVGNAGGTVQGADKTFGAPHVDSESFAEVGATTASLNAQLDTEGRAGTYWFEYGTSASYGSTTPPAAFAAGSGTVSAAAQLSGLLPDTVYHVRVVVTDVYGTTQGADITLMTFSPRVYGLPDGRVLEMVTPVAFENAGAYVPDAYGSGSVSHSASRTLTTLPFQVSADGNAVAYLAGPTSGGSNPPGGGNEYVATHTPGGNWTSVDVTPFGDNISYYSAFSSNLSTGILGSSLEPPLTADAPGSQYEVLYTRTGDGDYHALFTTKPPNRLSSEFGTTNIRSGQQRPLIYGGASADMSHLLFEANDALTSNAVDGGKAENNLYESFGGQLRAVNVLPGAIKSTPNASFGASAVPKANEEEPPALSRVISGDGTRIFWTDLNAHNLYVRVSGTTTMQIDASQGPGSSGGGLFWIASSDGSKVFFTDCSKLTPDSTALSGGGCGEPDRPEPELTGNDLYEYEVNPVAGQPGTLTDLTVDHNASDPLSADVQGVVGASEDGEYVYFVANGVMAPGAVSTQPNLYLRHAGETRLVATLAPIDNKHFSSQPPVGDWQPSLCCRSAEVTPDGRSITFLSQRNLTGYDSHGMSEVFVYESVTGKLLCVSCNPSGESPSVAGGTFAAALPVSWNGTYSARAISEDGSRVFFDSFEPLVPQDTNGVQDVYEWERDGTGVCRDSGGCVYLLSGGVDVEDSYLIGGSASGNDVFFATRAQLVPQDENEVFDVYDARVAGAQLLAPPACSGTGCQGVPPTPLIFATPASVTFSGVGNFSPPTPVKEKVKRKKKTKMKRMKVRHTVTQRGRARRTARRTVKGSSGR
jgi:hypothetical protein